MDPMTGLSLGRIAVGVGCLVSPERTTRTFGLDPAANPQLPFLARLLGVREVAIGTLTLLARGSARRRLVLAGIGVDAGDAVAGTIGLARKEVPVVAGGLLVAAAAGAVGSGIAALAASGSD